MANINHQKKLDLAPAISKAPDSPTMEISTANSSESPTMELSGRETQFGTSWMEIDKTQEPKIDPRATMCMPMEQFMTLAQPEQLTMREQAFAKQMAQPATHHTPMHNAEFHAKAKESAQKAYQAEAGMEMVFHALPRTQANGTRENQHPHLSDNSPSNLVIASVVFFVIGLIAISLFAATQAGVFDGLEERAPFLRPDISATTPAAGLSMPASPRVVSQANPALPALANENSAIRLSAPVASHVASTPNVVPAPTRKATLSTVSLGAAFQAASRSNTERLTELYTRYASGFPGLSGEVILKLTVDSKGRIPSGTIVTSSTGVIPFDQELLRMVMQWRLRIPAESRERVITIPFLFPLQGR